MVGAIRAGADAVYAGGSHFGARAYAKNFCQEELLDAIDYVHMHGRKLYLTVNTLLKNQEIEGELYEYLAPLYEQGLDAVIVQDLGVLQLIRKQFPGLHLHASTQMTVTGPEGMKFLEKKGVCRVVTARELSLEEIRRMHQESPLEIEAFVHGALCYCYSGQCLFSSVLGGRSGNRGRCAQPCRLPYQYASSERGYGKDKELHPLSPKDMCAIELLPEIISAGVTSLKIEGRMKQPGYTAGVVEVYRKYLDLYEQHPERYRVEKEDKERLLWLFSRGGSHEGYFRQHNGPEMMAFHSEKKIGDAYPQPEEKKEPVEGTLYLYPENPAILKLRLGELQVKVEGPLVQRAKNQPMSRERIRKQMEKTGDTPYVFQNLDIFMEEGIFLPVKAINELRREGFYALKKALTEPYRREKQSPLLPPAFGRDKHHSDKPLPIHVSCETKEQAEVCLKQEEIRRLYLPLSWAGEYLQEAALRGKEIYAMLPRIVRGEELKKQRAWANKSRQEGLGGFLVGNLEAYAWVRGLEEPGACILDASLYTWNHWAKSFWQEEGIAGDTIPLELNGKELRHRNNDNSEMLVYGYLPLMVSAQCVQKNMEACRKNQGLVFLKDRYQKEFPVKCYCDSCYNVIYNSLPYGLLKEAREVEALSPAAIRLSFTLEGKKETRQLLEDFIEVYEYHGEAKEHTFTKGHWKRGVE